MASTGSTRGFTLFETLIATGILVTALAGIAQLFVLSAHLTRHANVSGAALLAAQDKLEVLRGLRFAYDDAGVSITDPALQLSPSSSLDQDLDPYVDRLGADGVATANAAHALFVRRWRVSTVSAATPEAIAIEVCVFRAPSDGRRSESADSCLSTIRSRQP